MPAYKPYLTVKTSPSRMARKADRLKVFQFNKTLTKKRKKAEKELRNAE